MTQVSIVRLVLLHIICLRANVAGLLLALIKYALGGAAGWRFFEGSLWFQTDKQPMFAIATGPHTRVIKDLRAVYQDSNLVQHEEYHGEQGAATCMAFLPVDAVLLAHGHWIWALVLGSLTHAAFHYGANGIAWLRGEAMYEGASTEEGAHAVAAADDHDHH